MSIIRSILVTALFSTAFAGAALARDVVFTAKLDAPLAEPTRIITQNTIWNCEGDTCRARPTHAATARACRLLSHELGARIVAYGPEGGELNGDEINRCNGDSSVMQARN